MTYGIYRNGEIIPHPQYVFIEKEPIIKDGFYQSTEDILSKIEHIKASITVLGRSKITSEIAMEIKKKEAEMTKLNISLQKREYLPYKISFAHPSFIVKSGSIAYCLNIATMTTIDIDGKEYRVVDTRYVVAI